MFELIWRQDEDYSLTLQNFVYLDFWIALAPDYSNSPLVEEEEEERISCALAWQYKVTVDGQEIDNI